MLLAILSISSLFDFTYSSLSSLLHAYGYYAIIGLMTMEAASFPVPSEVVLPMIGYFAAKGVLNIYIALLVTFFSSFLGMALDYYIAYLLGKDIVYRHLGIFHIKKKDIEAFESWFSRNGAFAVFVSRFIPLVRGLINFPAGFALMPQKKFYIYSMAGSIIWDTVLVFFGYYALSASSATVLIVSIAVFAIVLYTIYVIAVKRIRKVR
ncbi:MAG: DedA family protein [Candidatus Micrarchaeia archaeon]